MTHHWIDHERALAGLPPRTAAMIEAQRARRQAAPMTGNEFCLRSREIAVMPAGNAKHRAMDLLTNELIRRLGPAYAEGLALWCGAIAGAHDESQPGGASPAPKE